MSIAAKLLQDLDRLKQNGFSQSNLVSNLHNLTKSLKAMLHEATFPATCNATMTNEKHCKLRWTCYTQQLVW